VASPSWNSDETILRAARYESWLPTTSHDFADRVIAVSVEAAERRGELDARRPTPAADGLIGATAAVHGWTLVTRITKDFEHIGVPMINPFES
jgi:toxin FitB